MTAFEQVLSGAKRSGKSALKSALAVIVAALAMTSAACDDARTPPTPAPIAAAPTSVPTGAPAPSPTAVPTSTPAPSPTAVPTSTPAPTPTAVPTNTPAPALTDADAMRIFEDAADAMSALSSYRVQMDAILDFGMGDKTKSSTDYYYQSPAMSKSKVVIESGAQTPVEIEAVSMGGYVYVKTSGDPFYDDPNDGKWIRGESVIASADDFMSDLLSSFGVDAAVGTERIDGVETRRLRGNARADDLGLALPLEVPVEVNVWIGVADGLIRRITATSEPAAAESVETTIVFPDFNVPVVVEAPKDYVGEGETQPPAPTADAPMETTVLSSGRTSAYLPDYGFSVDTPPDWSLFGSIGEAYYEMDDYLSKLSPEAENIANALSLATIHYFEPHRMIGFGTAAEGGETRVSALIVNITAAWEDAALSEYVDARIEQTESQLIIDGAIERRTETLPAGEAERVEFAFRFSEGLGMDFADDADYAQIQYFILAQGDAFILTFATTADRIDAMRPVFEDIARTARIEPRRERRSLSRRR